MTKREASDEPLLAAEYAPPGRRAPNSSRTDLRSESANERHELRLLLFRERHEAIACRAPLTVMREDRALDRRGPPVVQEGGEEPQAPEGGGPHLAAGGLSLLDAVAETAHVMEQEVGVRVEGAEWNGSVR